jgi:hypothetical protein
MCSDTNAVPAIGRKEFLLGLSAAAAGSYFVLAETNQSEHISDGNFFYGSNPRAAILNSSM